MSPMDTSATLDAVRAEFCFPPERPAYCPFSWKLDGGGRNIVLSLLDEKNITLMLEIGVLFGGSALQWLQHKADLIVVGIDPWIGNEGMMRVLWSNRKAYGLHNLQQGGLSDDAFLEQLLRPDAFYDATISNLWDVRDRFIPVRDRSPDALWTLNNLGLSPGLIFLDSDKELSDLWVCNDLWPNAVLCGDDWDWSDDSQPGALPVQETVNRFAAERGMRVRSRSSTWCLER